LIAVKAANSAGKIPGYHFAQIGRAKDSGQPLPVFGTRQTENIGPKAGVSEKNRQEKYQHEAAHLASPAVAEDPVGRQKQLCDAVVRVIIPHE
jgi:hypothetical protein